jgi:hypothetical protein
METQQIRQIVVQELPIILQQNREVQQAILRIARGRFAEQAETESRFDRLLDELRRDREEQSRKWEANQAVINQMMAEQGAKWAEQTQRWHEQQEKWEANQAQINEMLRSIRDLGRRLEVGISALGARWGIQSEEAFRNALKGILEDSFPSQVDHLADGGQAGATCGSTVGYPGVQSR